MRDHLATLLDDFRRYDRQIAVVRYRGIRRRATTYGELARLAGRFAALLVELGIEPGDRVLIWAENSAEWMAAFYGCLLRGALAVPLDAYGSVEFAKRVAADVQPKLAVGDALLVRQLPADYQRIPFEEWLGVLPAEEAGPVDGLTHDTPLQILFTSGTTGDPKGVVITHGNVLASITPIEEGAQPYMRWERLLAHPLRILHTLPLSHVFGQTMGLWVPPIFTAELHFESRLVASRLVETVKRERISVLAAVPRVMALLKTHLEAEIPSLADRVAESERKMGVPQRWWKFRDVHGAFGLKFWALISGGGALASPLEKFWNTLGFVVVQGYGMTETTALITLNHPFHVARGTIGKPLVGREVKLGPDGEVLVRGASISGATWSGGALHPRTDEWLATGDLAETEPSGELRFVGRKSEVIVTSSGVNLHPEDLEAAVEQEANVAACAVVAMETATGPEPCAVLAMRGISDGAAAAIEGANRRLAEFQRLRHWMLWPEPDLPRTSTGKVKRKAVSEWLRGIQAACSTAFTGEAAGNGAEAFRASADWLLALIAQISGETPRGVGDELRLTEDLQLDSLGRVQLAAALEERLGVGPRRGSLEEAQTLGELRRLVAGEGDDENAESEVGRVPRNLLEERISGIKQAAENLFALKGHDFSRAARFPKSTLALAPEGCLPPISFDNASNSAAPAVSAYRPEAADGTASIAYNAHELSQAQYVYPRWPWLPPFQWLRVAFIEAVAQPLVWLLANPRVAAPELPLSNEPMLIVANHVTTFDGPLVQYALPKALRRRIAVAMSGDMLEDYRHFRNPESAPGTKSFYLPGPLIYLLLTALFNVFPLPRRRNFQQSFAHAGAALDHGYNVLVFPEGTRSAEGELARFRGGIGLLVKESSASVLPVALRGLGELKAAGRGWFRSGKIEVRVGEPIRFAPEDSEATITDRLHAEVSRLLVS
jgi:long-chain acyl-CoA synthetase